MHENHPPKYTGITNPKSITHDAKNCAKYTVYFGNFLDNVKCFLFTTIFSMPYKSENYRPPDEQGQINGVLFRERQEELQQINSH